MAVSQVSQTQTFDRALSLRLDAILAAIDKVQAWPDGEARRACLAVLEARRRVLEAQIPV